MQFKHVLCLPVSRCVCGLYVMQFQQKQIAALCHRYLFSREMKLPGKDGLREYYSHLIFDDHRKSLFCYVPKVGVASVCTGPFYMHAIALCHAKLMQIM